MKMTCKTVNGLLKILVFWVLIFENSKIIRFVNAQNDFTELLQFIKNNVTIERNKRYDYSSQDIVNSFNNVTPDECFWQCYARKRCRASEYRLQAKYCLLLRKVGTTETQAGRLVAHGFVDKADRKCGSVTCSALETCVYANNVFSCIIDECRNPIGGPNTYGNIYKVGSRCASKCGAYVMLKCANTGQWWDIQGKQSGLTCEDLPPTTDYTVFTNRLGITLGCSGVDNYLVLQRRRFGFLDFFRDWDDYKYGFGSECAEYWLGLENLQAIMEESGQQFRLSVHLLNWDNEARFAYYNRFGISDESDLYRLTIGSYVTPTSNAGDSLDAHNGLTFSTYDRDSDAGPGNCGAYFKGGWWFNYCYAAYLNGFYYQNQTNRYQDGILWVSWLGSQYSLKETTMRIRLAAFT